MRDRFGATNPRAQQLRFHTQTAGSTLTAQQPDNNIVRVALQAMAAVLGGTQSLHCNGRDEALALPTEDSARMALRTQQIIAAETGVANTVDPVGGSYAIEALTDDIEHGRRGAARAHRRGRRDAGRHRDRVHSARDPGVGVPRAAWRSTAGETVVVGVNRFADDGRGRGTRSIRVPDRSRTIERQQVERVRAVRASRAIRTRGARRSTP